MSTLNIMNKRVIVLSIVGTLFVIWMGVVVGSSGIELPKLLSIIANKTIGLPLIEGIKANEVSIIWMLRLPRVLLAFFVGASLAVSGCAIQSILRNPLASPFTLGVSSGASFAVACTIMSGLTIPLMGKLTITSMGFLGGLLTILFVIAFTSLVDRSLSNQTIILGGMVFSLFINAILTIIISLAHEELHQIIKWQMGSLALRSWSYVGAIMPFFVIGTFGVLYYSRELDALSFGEENAISLGIDTKKVKKRIIVFSALLAGSAVAVSGTIGFIGLVAPHVVRKIIGARHNMVIPMSILFGGSFLILCDMIARTMLSPTELPVGAITAIIGAPFFAVIYFGNRRS